MSRVRSPMMALVISFASSGVVLIVVLMFGMWLCIPKGASRNWPGGAGLNASLCSGVPHWSSTVRVLCLKCAMSCGRVCGGSVLLCGLW